MADVVPRGTSGCFRYGCIVALVLALTIGTGLFLYVRYAIRSAVVGYIEPQKAAIERASVEPALRATALREGREAVRSAFAKVTSLATENTPSEIELTALQLEELLRSALPDLLSEGSFAISIDPKTNEIIAHFALNIQNLAKYWGYFESFASEHGEKFLNGSATFTLSVTNRAPSVTVSRLIVRGTDFPEMGRTSAASWMKEYLSSLLSSSLQSSSAQSSSAQSSSAQSDSLKNESQGSATTVARIAPGSTGLGPPETFDTPLPFDVVFRQTKDISVAAGRITFRVERPNVEE